MSVQAGAQTGSGPKFASDLDGSSDNWQFVKLAFGPIGTYTIASLTNGFPIQPATGAAFPVTQSGAWTIATLPALPAGTNLIGQVTANAPLADKATFTEGTSTVMPMGAVMNDTLAGSLSEDTVAAPRITPKRALHINLRDQSGNEVGTASNALVVGDGGGAMTVDGTVAATQSGTWNVTNAGTFAVQDKPATSGGLSSYHVIAAATTNAANVKSSAGQVYTVSGFNNGTNVAYVKLYNTASAPTPASSTVVATYMLPAGGGVVYNIDKGIAFSTGIGIAIVNGISDTDNTAVAASTFAVNLGYV